MRIIKDPISLVSVTHGLVYNSNFISGGGGKHYRGNGLVAEIIKQIPRRIKENNQ